jgi:cytochrome c oxidase assembly protein subunit 15
MTYQIKVYKYSMEINKISDQKKIVVWLYSVVILLMIMIIVGGATRLTDSGLSITQWELFSGIFPPINEIEWNKYFNLYKEIPQYKLINQNISISEFKIIFYWEYFHRLLGRVIGLVMFIPLLYFTFKKTIPIKTLVNLYIIFLMICLQGFVGWYMVESGLVNNTTVSHFRLSIHLTLAFIIFSSIIWNLKNIVYNQNIKFLIFNRETFIYQIFLALIFLQIVFGAFVSGLDAGKIYQSWPLMNSSYVPDDIQSFTNFYDPSLIQFYHRNIAYIIFALTLFISYKTYKKDLDLFKRFLLIFSIVLFQVFLGILTLITDVNIFIAIMHQFTGLLLVSSSILFYYKYLQKRVK